MIAFRDRDIPALRRSVSMVFQNHRLLQDRTVYENVAFAMEVTGTPRSVVKRRTLALLRLCGARSRLIRRCGLRRVNNRELMGRS